jgi:uncharacterized LabA/DUF88 family protein
MQLLPRPQRDIANPKPSLAFEPLLETALEKPAPGNDPSARSQTIADPLTDREHNRLAIFIDGANLFYAASRLNLEIDYSKLLCQLTKQRRLIRAYFYTGINLANEKQQKFLLWLRRKGYRVMTKELIQYPDGSKKANLDVEMVVDMLSLAHYCDTVVLLSGNGDLTYAANAIADRGVWVEVVSLRSMTSDQLINVADCYIDLDTIKGEIQKDK